MLSKKFPLLPALALAFAFCACDSSTSATTQLEEIDSSASGEKVPGSSDSTKPDKGNTENSSDSKTNPGSTNSGKTNSSSSKAVNTLDGNLTEQQAELIDMLKEFAAGNDETKKLTESCEDGDKTTQEIMNQPIEFTCMFESWVPTDGMKEFFENLDPSIQGMILENTGMTKEEMESFIDFMSTFDPSNNDFGVTCNGEINDDEWEASGSGIMGGLPVNFTGHITFNGSTMTSVTSGAFDVGSESNCKSILKANEDDEEEEDDSESTALYGEITDKSVSCDGKYLVQTETRVKENVSESERAAAYEDAVGECKDYRDGKITFEELMEN